MVDKHSTATCRVVFTTLSGVAAAAAVLLFAGAAQADDQPASGWHSSTLGSLPGGPANDSGARASGDVANFVGDAYPLDTCFVSGEKLDARGGMVEFVYKGRDIRCCCQDCIEEFKQDPDKYLAKIDAAIIAQQQDSYPLKTCPVSDAVIGSMGEGDNMVVDNVLIRLCCSGCEEDIRSDPQKYVDIVDQARIDAQKPDYPLDSCIVDGKPLGPDAVDYIFGGRLVRFDSKVCVAKFLKAPLQYMDKLDGKNAGLPDETETTPDTHPDMQGMPGGSGIKLRPGPRLKR